MNKIYTGVGSRETPAMIGSIMCKVAIDLARDGWCPRSGGARKARTRLSRKAGGCGG